MAKPWFRVYWEMLDDPKIGPLSDAEFRAWLAVLMVQCAHGDEEGCTGMDSKGIAWRVRRDYGVEIEKLASVGLLDIDENGIVSVWQWGKRQWQSDTSTERVRKYRKRKMQQEETVTGNVSETLQPSVSVLTPEREQIQIQIQSGNVSPTVTETVSMVSSRKEKPFVELPDPYGWEDFAAVYPAFRLKPDKAAKSWFRRNITDTPEGHQKLAQIIGNVVQWNLSEQWIQNGVPNCSKYLDEGIWQGVPGPPPYKSGHVGQQNMDEYFAGAEN